MTDNECVALLQWALPRLHMRWLGFRKVRGQVCKRIRMRMRELHLDNAAAYRVYLMINEDEWPIFDEMCRVSVSRFYRDRLMFTFLEQEVLPTLVRQAGARGDTKINVWSVGCGCGEEPYTIALLWRMCLRSIFPEIQLNILATDSNPSLIHRARAAAYHYSSVKNLPENWREEGFTRRDSNFILKPEYQRDIRFSVEDVRETMPLGKFDLVLCRNLVFTYYEEPLQRELLERIKSRMRDNAALVLGVHEQLPEDPAGFEVWSERLRVYKKVSQISRPYS